MKTYTNKQVRKGWCMYDWANSVYSLVITSAIFPLFYSASTSDTVILFGREFVNTALIGYTGALGFVIVSILMPMFTGIADHFGRKRFFLRLFSTIGALACIGLYFFNPGVESELPWTLLCYMIALLGFWLSIVFYNSYLPEIAPPEDHDKLSAKGFSFGYIGSVILLAICLVLIMKIPIPADWDFLRTNASYLIRVIENPMPAKWAFVMTGIWWLVFTQWPLKVLPAGRSKYLTDLKILSKGFKEIRHVWSQVKKTVRLKKFTQAFFVYSMGVQTVMLVAVYFAAKEIDWPDSESQTTGLIVSILLIQLIAIPGAYVMSRMSFKMGNIKALIIVNVFWAILCLGAIFIHTPTQFYFMAALVGFVMGGIQSLSRSTYSKFLPEVNDTASYFSFFDVSEKIGLAIGLFLFAYLEEVGTLSSDVSNGALGGMRLSIVSLVVFFIAGVFLLMRVPKEEVVLTTDDAQY